MKKARASGIRKEYDFRGAVRGKYSRRFGAGNNLIVLDPDLARRFRDSRSVNDALRTLVEIADRKAAQTR